MKNLFSRFWKSEKHSLKIILDSFKNPDMPQLVILGAVIGIIGGVGAAIFYNLIGFFKDIFFAPSTTDTFLDVVRALPWYHRVLAPALGGLIIGPLITFFVQEAKGHGVPEVMESVALKGGVIRGRVAPLKAVISAICIGSGGSAGREGPIVQIGASFGSFVGQFLDLEPDEVETLLGAGAAAGIAGTFNAPLAGVLFSLEVLLKDIKLKSFSPIVVASVVGTVIANILLGGRGAVFDIPPHVIVSVWEFIPYLLLGVVAAGVALLFENSLYYFEHLFAKLPMPEYLKPALGGLLLGVMALMVPEIHATGYPVMEGALHANFPFLVVFGLLFAKILATNLTLGSGGSGGIFAPSLFIGSMLGSSYGIVVHNLFPAMTAGPSSYATVGMGAVFAGATHAPLTSIIILFEMTQDHRIILPMMFSCIVSTVITSRVQKKNIYTTKLLNRGVDITSINKEQVLKNIAVEKVMSTNPITIPETATFAEARSIFEKTFYTYLPVVKTATGELVGVINYHTISRQLKIQADEEEKIEKYIFPAPGVVYPDDNLLKASRLINEVNARIIPVIDNEETHRLLGIVNRTDLIQAYHESVTTYHDEIHFDLSPKMKVDVDHLIDVAVHALEKEIRDKELEIEVDLEENLPPVQADSNKISWVIINLLDNAIHHSGVDDNIAIASWKSGEWIFISVEDSGKGIAPEDQEKIFEQFVCLTRDDEHCDSGLGLAISKEIVEAHKGRIWVESAVGEGSKFVFSLKAVTGDQTEQQVGG